MKIKVPIKKRKAKVTNKFVNDQEGYRKLKIKQSRADVIFAHQNRLSLFMFRYGE